jgi:transcriptional regulator with XRE-family HTH domain
MSNSPKILRKNLAKLIKKGEVQATAARIGIARQQLSAYLAGDTVPELEQIDRIAKGIGTTTLDLLRDPDVAESSEPSLFTAMEKVRREMRRIEKGSPEEVLALIRSLLGEVRSRYVPKKQ